MFERLLAVGAIFLIMGGLGGVAIWWVAGQRKLHKQRDFRGMMKRRRELWQGTALIIAGVLMALAFLGAAYVFARGGAL